VSEPLANEPNGTPPVKVAYIIGWKRSGSTIVGNALGEVQGFFHAGELRTLWGKGLLNGRYCGCGRPVAECEVWSDVLRRAGLENLVTNRSFAQSVVRWQFEAVRMRRFRQLLRGADERTGSLASYADVMERTYAALADSSGAKVIVDSSKQPADAALLGSLQGVDPYFVHLVRDPRAVAFSWQRRKSSPGEGRREEMMQFSPATSTRNWMIVNLAAETIRRRYGASRFLRVRYEDFVIDPRGTLASVCDLMGEPNATLPIDPDGSVHLAGGHTAGGNPDRFKTGKVQVRLDDEWTRAQQAPDRITATLISLPLLARYRYPIQVRASQ
jgi:Sulfotransferase family